MRVKENAENTIKMPERKNGDRLIALAGNPNVGKSTIFNALTGMHQHTGNWAGKTVVNAFGRYEKNGCSWLVADLPGCCTLTASSAEECDARDFICREKPDVIVVVCSAVCLERGIVLLLQILEMTGNAILCVNLMDEAKRKGIEPELDILEKRLGVPVVGTSARSVKGIEVLVNKIKKVAESDRLMPKYLITYPPAIESAIARLEPEAERICPSGYSHRWLALRELDGESDMLNGEQLEQMIFRRRREECLRTLELQGFDRQAIGDCISQAASDCAEKICSGVVPSPDSVYGPGERFLDRLLTGKYTGWIVMLMLLSLVLWITLEGANYISDWLSGGFNYAEKKLDMIFEYVGVPEFWHGLLVTGVFRVLGWVVSVMLPPMAIFFPLFTLLEDVGYLPRVAFNLDGGFQRCGACGKQALTMCMGLGCNAAGVIGCRIIASPRERLVAVLTNSFMPCNGRFPTMLTVITLFLSGMAGSFGSALILGGLVILGVFVTLLTSALLTSTVLRGKTSFFTLELPPFRRPQIGKTLLRSLFDRTLTVLRRAVAVAIPAGAIIWLLANITAGDRTLLGHVTDYLDPVGKIMGVDGVTLTAFVLGFPANELVLPVAMMAYSSQGELMEIAGMQFFGDLLVSVGWDWKTAVSVLLFSLMHWPCSTTCMTIWKETRSALWTLIAFVLPTVCGFLCCAGFNLAVRLLES